MKLTDEQCEAYRNLNLSGNNVVRAVYQDGIKEGYAQALIAVLDSTKNLMKGSKNDENH